MVLGLRASDSPLMTPGLELLPMVQPQCGCQSVALCESEAGLGEQWTFLMSVELLFKLFLQHLIEHYKKRTHTYKERKIKQLQPLLSDKAISRTRLRGL